MLAAALFLEWAAYRGEGGEEKREQPKITDRVVGLSGTKERPPEEGEMFRPFFSEREKERGRRDSDRLESQQEGPRQPLHTQKKGKKGEISRPLG